VSSPFQALFSGRPVLLAPMEDVTDEVFRRLCRTVGAGLCYTEFVNVESLLKGDRKSRRKVTLPPEDAPTAIQVYGANPDTLCEAAAVAEEAAPAFIDINCGCWVPKIVGRGAGSAWLRDPPKMVEMAARVVKSVSLPVTVKTRIGWGPESEMPIVDLARRLEDVGVSALTVHCRTAQMRHDGNADWTWAAKAQAVVRIPVVVNGDVRTGEDALRALERTGCAAVMVGRGAMAHPWIFREARALLDGRPALPPPSAAERLDFLAEHLRQNVAFRGERNGVDCTRRHYTGYLATVPGGAELRTELNRTPSLQGCLDAVARVRDALTPAAA
jgi:tRNA-dihydrouridine synthase B